jgi:hypothetical protein
MDCTAPTPYHGSNFPTGMMDSKPMDRETILRELAKIEDRVSRTQVQLAWNREHISHLRQTGQWAKLMLQRCEDMLALDLSLHAKLARQLSRSS